MSQPLSFVGTGKLSAVDGAADQAAYDAGQPIDYVFREITFTPTQEQLSTRVANEEGILEPGDELVKFSAFDISVRMDKANANNLMAFFQGSAGVDIANYRVITPMAASKINRSGVAKLALYHPALGSSTPQLKWDYFQFQSLRPNGAVSRNADGEALFEMILRVKPLSSEIQIYDSTSTGA